MRSVRNRRRLYLVNRKIQMQFTWLLLIEMAIPTIILGALFYIVNKRYLSFIQRILGESVVSDPYIQSILNFSILSIGVFLIAWILLLLFLGIRVTHHIAGPLYKLEQSMDKLLKGEKIERLHFRKTDVIDEIADKFNAIAEKLSQVK